MSRTGTIRYAFVTSTEETVRVETPRGGQCAEPMVSTALWAVRWFVLFNDERVVAPLFSFAWRSHPEVAHGAVEAAG
jgi:hypothetical protein